MKQASLVRQNPYGGLLITQYLMNKTFKEIAEEVERDKQRQKEREANLDKATFIPRIEKICPYCGKKHDRYCKICYECSQINDNLEHGINWKVP